MASTKDAEFHEKTAEQTAENPIKQGSLEVEQNVHSDFTETCPAILEPSEGDPLFKRDTTRRPLKTYRAIMRSFTSTEILKNSDELSDDGKSAQRWTNGCRVRCLTFFKGYQNFTMKFRTSRLIYIVQILLMVLSFSATAMGVQYNESCPGSPDLAFLTTLSGIFGMMLVGQWAVIKCCTPENRPCEGQQKCFLLLFFILLSGILELEIYRFSKLSPSFEPSTTNYCSKIFYDFTYYKFIAAFWSMLLVVLIYLPDYQHIASGVVCSDPLSDSCYKGYLEDDED